MFPSAEPSPVAVESGTQVRSERFGQEVLALPERPEGDCAGWVCTFMKHDCVQSSHLRKLGQRDSYHIARRRPKNIRSSFPLVPVVYRAKERSRSRLR